MQAKSCGLHYCVTGARIHHQLPLIMRSFLIPPVITSVTTSTTIPPTGLNSPLAHTKASIEYFEVGELTVIRVHASIILTDNVVEGSISAITQIEMLTPFDQISRQTKLRMLDAGCQSAAVEFLRTWKGPNGKSLPLVLPEYEYFEQVLDSAKKSEVTLLPGSPQGLS
jgi:hypothetical protein